MKNKYLLIIFLTILFPLLSYGAKLKFEGNFNFGKVKISESKNIKIIVKNTARRKIRLDSSWFQSSSSFSLNGGTCSFDNQSLAPNASCDLIINFKPIDKNEQAIKFYIGYYKGRSWKWRETSVQFSGRGVNESIPTPPPLPIDKKLSFILADGQVMQIKQNKELEILVNLVNNSSDSIRIDEYWLESKSREWKVNSNNCPQTLETNQACQYSLYFKSDTVGESKTSMAIGYYKNSSWTWNEIKNNLFVKVLKGSTTDPQQAIPAIGKLHTQGNKIVDSKGNTVILRGVNIADPEHLNTKTQTRPGVSAISVATSAVKDYNAKVVRIPVLPGSPRYPTEGWFGPHNGGEKYFKRHIEPLVEELTSQGIYVIIDLHYISDYNGLGDEVNEFWEFMAPKYKDNPYVIYELMNEPILPDNWDHFKNEIAAPGVRTIRKHAPDTLIIVGSPYWSSHLQGITDNPIDSHNIIYTAHIYSNQPERKWEQNYGPTMAKYPVMVTEWGFEEGGTEGGTKDFGIPFLKFMKDKGVSWTVWCFDNRWGPRMFDKDWNLKGGHGGMGELVKGELAKE